MTSAAVEGMVLSRLIMAAKLVMDTWQELQIPEADREEHLRLAVAKQPANTVVMISSVADLLSNVSTLVLLPRSAPTNSPLASPAMAGAMAGVMAGAMAGAVVVTAPARRVVITSMRLSYAEFSRFKSAPEGGALPVSESEYVVSKTLYDSSSYRNKVTSKDPTAPNFLEYRKAKEAAWKARGVCFDKAAFMELAAPFASSLKKKSNMWQNYCISRDLLLGFKRFETSRSSTDPRPVKRQRKAKLLPSAAVSLDAIAVGGTGNDILDDPLGEDDTTPPATDRENAGSEDDKTDHMEDHDESSEEEDDDEND